MVALAKAAPSASLEASRETLGWLRTTLCPGERHMSLSPTSLNNHLEIDTCGLLVTKWSPCLLLLVSDACILFQLFGVVAVYSTLSRSPA